MKHKYKEDLKDIDDNLILLAHEIPLLDNNGKINKMVPHLYKCIYKKLAIIANKLKNEQ